MMLLSRFMYSRAKQTFNYRDGAHVLLAKSDSVSCPFHLLNRHVSAANSDLPRLYLFSAPCIFIKLLLIVGVPRV